MSRGIAVILLVTACGSRTATPTSTTPSLGVVARDAPDDRGTTVAPGEPTPPAAADPAFDGLNLDFEQGDGTTGWVVDSPGSGASDTTVKHGGARSLRLSSERAGAPATHAELRAPVESVRGRRVKLVGWMKTRDVADGWAGIWLRADGTHDGALFEDLRRRGHKGTHEWLLLEVTLFVPHEAERVTIGASLHGAGTAWFDDLTITVDDERPETIEQLTGIPLSPRRR